MQKFSLFNKIFTASKKGFDIIKRNLLKLKNFIISLFLKNSPKKENSSELDKKLIFSLSKSRIPKFNQIKHIKKYLNKKELWTIRICAIIILASLIFLSIHFYSNHRQESPVGGDTYIEGVITPPKNINPLYSTLNNTDNDLSDLIYSSLFKKDSTGELINDLAENYELSSDNKIYTIKIKPGVKWQNGRSLTADDIIFTFNAIKNKDYSSPLRRVFDGVSIDKIDENTIKFTLNVPYAGFLNLLNFGIMPAELWGEIPPQSANLAELNIKPVGSGPYKVTEIIKDKNGNIKEYLLVFNEDYYGKKPYLNINFKVFSNQDELISALNNGDVDGVKNISRDLTKEILYPMKFNFYKLKTPRLNAIFLNKEKNIALEDKNVRQALAYALNKQSLVDEVLGGDGIVIDSPIFPDNFAYLADIKKYDYNVDEANKLLTGAGWKLENITEQNIAEATTTKDAVAEVGVGAWRKKNGNFLIIKLTVTPNIENEKVAEKIKNYWEKIGVKVEINQVDSQDIISQVIKPRNFEALLYSQSIDIDPDPYPYWHSSQIKESGLNISNFSNQQADKLLEDGRVASDKNVRAEKYKEFQKIYAEEIPVIFLYSPSYLYIQSNKIKGFKPMIIFDQSDRFINSADWYKKTKKQIAW